MNVRQAILSILDRRAQRRQERGTILILAIAVLAVLSLLAVSYVTVVRIDRDSSDAVAVSRDFDQQVGTVVRHMQSLLTADLFGNKIVTPAVPRQTAAGLSIWPSMFEDGEYYDIDSIDLIWARANPSQAPTLQNGRILRPDQVASRRVARPDDAWLASTEPRWQNNGFTGQPYFEQFTNLRSAFTWDTRNQQWVRGDGLYVDLAQWFLNPLDGRANAGVNLLDPTGSEVTAVRSALYSIGSEVRDRDNVDYSRQMSQLTPGGNQTILEPSDERFFVDTTGDLRPDAQWTQLEELGNLYGLVWLVGARITDASALANLNTAIEAPAFNLSPGTVGLGRDYHQVVATGETPADVDLVRLLTYNYGLNLPNGVFVNGTPNVNRILSDGVAFRNHLERGLGYREVLTTLQDQQTPGYIRALDPTRAGLGESIENWQWSGPVGTYQPLTRNQRRYMYEQVYSRTGDVYPRAQRYPERAMLDLHAFWGTNNATLVSKPEQYLDGPENGGFLPALNNNADNGPLRAAEVNVPAIRAFGTAANARPTLQQLEFDNRRTLTTASGAGRYNPVPILNTGRNARGELVTDFDGTYFRQQHDLAVLARARELQPKQAVSSIFGDMIWALAPFATDRELLPSTQPGTQLPFNRLSDIDLHYGGGPNGPAQRFAALFGDANIGAAYAIHRAGAFAVNLADALDRVQPNQNSQTRERPTVLRFFPRPDLPPQLPLFQGYEQVFATSRFPHGDLDFASSSISSRYLGEGSGGISFIGVDRQPFLVEAHTLAVYQSDAIGSRPTIVPARLDHHVGSIIAFELANPWPDPITIIGSSGGGLGGDPQNGGHVFRIVRDESWIEFSLSENTQIPAGGRGIFYWSSRSDDSAFAPEIMDQIRAGWRDELENATSGPIVFQEIGRGLDDQAGSPANISTNFQASLGGVANPVIPFQEMATGLTGRTQVQLIRLADNPIFGSNNQAGAPPQPERKGDMLIDRMTTSQNSSAGGEGILWNDFFGALREQRTHTFETPEGSPMVRGNFRISVHGTMHRAPRRPVNQEGFPAYVVERPAFNTIIVAGHNENSVGGGISSDYVQIWRSGSGGGDGNPDPNQPTGGNVNDPLVGPDPIPELWTPRDAQKLARDDERPEFQNLPAFQLFNPGGPFSSVSDVALVSAFCHMYLHDNEVYPSGYSIMRVNQYSTRYGNSNQGQYPGFNVNQPELDGGRWLTFSEQLGFDFHLEGPDGLSPTQNHWYGLIDPTRYRFGSPLQAVNGLPDSMAVPLGSRMFDLFSTMDSRDFLVPGLVNINTALRRVLSILPHAEPLQPVQDGSGSILAATPPAFGGGGGNSRAAKLFNYRERLQEFGPIQSGNAIQAWTGIEGLRTTNFTRGFVTKGEIPLIGRRQQNGVPFGNQPGTFVELAANNQNAKSPPFETWSDTGLPLSFGTTQQRAYAFTDYNPANDAEEQLALFRSIANIATTRSDVFMATFVLRGYDPDVIESIEVPGGTGGAGALQAMNDPAFRPAYESRWLVVFDRSNVRQPTDRPRILLRVELPSAVP